MNTGHHDLMISMSNVAGAACEQLPSGGRLIPGEMLYIHADLTCVVNAASPGHNGSVRLWVEQGDEMTLGPAPH